MPLNFPSFLSHSPTPHPSVHHHRRRCRSRHTSITHTRFPRATHAAPPIYRARNTTSQPNASRAQSHRQLPKKPTHTNSSYSLHSSASLSSRSIYMGNFASCTLVRIPGSARGARVVLPDGAVRVVTLPAKAAELMLEAPGHFLADAHALQAGRRIAALGADEDLELGGVYAALPMKRLGAPAAPADVARLAAAVAREAQARRSASAKVAAVVVAPPELVVAAAFAAAEEDAPIWAPPRLDEMAVDAAVEIGELKQRISSGRRSRRPTLETIQEESYAYAAQDANITSQLTA